MLVDHCAGRVGDAIDEVRLDAIPVVGKRRVCRRHLQRTHRSGSECDRMEGLEILRRDPELSRRVDDYSRPDRIDESCVDRIR